MKEKKVGIILRKWFHPIVLGTKNVIDMHFAFYRCKNLHQRKWSVQGYCVTEWWSNILGHQPLFQNQLPEKFHSSKQLRSHYTRFVHIFIFFLMSFLNTQYLRNTTIENIICTSYPQTLVANNHFPRTFFSTWKSSWTLMDSDLAPKFE